MSENTLLLTEVGGCEEEKWKMPNWSARHQVIVAAEASFHIEVGNPKVALRFFLRSKEKLVTYGKFKEPTLSKWYSLCAEVLTQLNENAAIKVTARFCNGKTDLVSKVGTIPINKSKGKVVEVIDGFIYLESSDLDQYGLVCEPSFRRTTQGFPENDIAIIIAAQMFRLTITGKKVASAPIASDTEKSFSSREEADSTLANDLKNMFVAHENYADLKLESKDHMILDAHKFILAARSRYLQKTIDEAVKMENFNGTIKMNINGKPLVVILHWMYTGELHETASNVMDEVVDVAILFELTYLMKLLDTKIITICNKENMFRLYQVAQKNGMPNAMDDISAYIRQHL